MPQVDKITQQEIKRRRTFAIISHPDAGKTTITDKLLFLGGAILEAGEVKGKQGKKQATSDWMKMEQERGVSITSSVMQFEYKNLMINLLDTPGHADFGEDTYRTLVAADSAAMLLDAAKGVEAQTKKLYEVCRLRKMPMFTFANKVDREGKTPLEIIDDVESTLGMSCFPINWPLGFGSRFKGLYDRLQKKLYLYDKVDGLVNTIEDIEYTDSRIDDLADAEVVQQFREDLELVEALGYELDEQSFLQGKVSPLCFGSAKYLWGIDLFLQLFAELAPAPLDRETMDGKNVQILDKDFSGFVFKIQANMDKRHRDRVSFIRICSGKFTRGMKVWHDRLQRDIRLNYANQFMAQSRETSEFAFAGDILGVNDSGLLQIGDSISIKKGIKFSGIPRFSPEHFGKIYLKDTSRKKQLEKGIQQLCDEGSIQKFKDPSIGWQDPVLAVVGPLQFEVLIYRLKDEYGVEAQLQKLPFSLARWVRDAEDNIVDSLKGGIKLHKDIKDESVCFFEREWNLSWAQKENPDVIFYSSSKN